MASALQAYVWGAESSNRLQNGPDPNNPTNNIIVPTEMPDERLPVLSMNLGSAELPLPQYTVERAWNKLYFDEGIRLIVNSVADLCVRTFEVSINGEVFDAILPIYLNPIIEVDTSNATSPIFTTMFEHALDLRG